VQQPSSSSVSDREREIHKPARVPSPAPPAPCRPQHLTTTLIPLLVRRCHVTARRLNSLYFVPASPVDPATASRICSKRAKPRAISTKPEGSHRSIVGKLETPERRVCRKSSAVRRFSSSLSNRCRNASGSGPSSSQIRGQNAGALRSSLS